MTDLNGALQHAEFLAREQHGAALIAACDLEGAARLANDARSLALALALRGRMLLARGDLDAACAVSAELEGMAIDPADLHGHAMVALFSSQLGFYLGAFGDAITSALAAIEQADRSADSGLRLLVRRETCFVVGSIRLSSLAPLIQDRIELARDRDDPWELTLALNDRAFLALLSGDVEDAHRGMTAAEHVAATLAGPTPIVSGVLGTTRAEILIAEGRSDEATTAVRAVMAELGAGNTPNHYLFAIATSVAVTVLTAAGRVDEAEKVGRDALLRLGEAFPRARSTILSVLAEGLRTIGRSDEAYDVLSQSLALERHAASQLSSLQHDLHDALIDRTAAKQEAARFQDEADRDWLTGLHNRRYLARHDVSGDAVGVVVVDLDFFKSINDTHGHETGDRVLMRFSHLLVAAARAGDTVVRLGGDEFLVVMNGVGETDVAACAARLRATVNGEPWHTLVPGISVNVSVGYAAGPRSTPLDELIREADANLYTAKAAGRGRTVGSLEPVAR